jgi:hypothetical protein
MTYRVRDTISREKGGSSHCRKMADTCGRWFGQARRGCIEASIARVAQVQDNTYWDLGKIQVIFVGDKTQIELIKSRQSSPYNLIL